MTDRDTPFFIIGSSRSGTTLLRLLMTGHSRIHIPPETWFILPLVQQFPLDAALSPAQVEQAVEIVTRHRRWADMGMAAEDFRAAVAALPSPRLVDIIDVPYRRHLQQAGKPRFGDKTPPYVGIVPQLATLYPGARFIHLIRDGRDVAISFTDAKFHGRSYHGGRFEWTQAIRHGLAYRDSAYATQILEVRYEDLVRDLEATTRRICVFLGEAFEPAMLTWNDRLTAVPAKGKSIHTKLTRPVSDDAIAVWRQKLSMLECFVIESSLHRELRSLDYPLRFAGPAWRPILAGSGVALRAMAPLLDRAIPALQRRDYFARTVYL